MKTRSGQLLVEHLKVQDELMNFYVRNARVPRSWRDLMLMLANALIDESVELRNAIGWKPWKNTVPKEEAISRAREELVDIWHFVLQMILLLYGNDASAVENLFKDYMDKVQINIDRQLTGRDDPAYQIGEAHDEKS